jgi:hypothetical protein
MLRAVSRAIIRNYRATNVSDPGRVRRVSWEIYGPIGASVESTAGVLRAPRCGVALAALVGRAFHPALDPDHDLGVHRLRTGKAAPQPPDSIVHGTAQRRHDQRRRQVDEVLRQQGEADRYSRSCRMKRVAC